MAESSTTRAVERITTSKPSASVQDRVENALKHTPRGTHIAVQVGTSVEGDAWLQVCDDGAPAPDEAAAGAKAPSADSLHLGHEILRRVAEVHGGHFGVAPAPAPFTTCFRLDLPQGPAMDAG